MVLSDSEARVLAALIEKEASVPESYPMTINALRLACNQSTNRRPVVSYDDRTVEAAVMTLKSVGLVRFVHPSHGGRTTRYRQTAGERWRLSAGELIVLSALVLRGAQTVADVRARVERLLPAEESSTIEEMLDTLAARSPEPLAVRVGRRPGERDDRWAALLGTSPAAGVDDTGPLEVVDPAWRDDPKPAPAPEPAATMAELDGAELDELRDRVESLAATIGAVAARLERLEQRLGVSGRT